MPLGTARTTEGYKKKRRTKPHASFAVIPMNKSEFVLK
jgi:hypothetical protein